MVNALELAQYILKHSNKELSNLELQKTLYFTELDYIKKFDKHLVSDDFEAWRYGPVAREVYYEYRNYGANPIDKPKEETLSQNLRKDELETINHSIEKCNEKSYWDLVKESHKEDGAWHKSFKEDRKEIISKDLIRQKPNKQMETKEEDKDKKLEEIIVLLCEERDLSNQKDQIIKDLKEIYQGEYKHKYSKITTIILNSTRDKEQAFMTLTQNIKTLKEIQGNKEVESIKPKLEKLYDHMNLECIRLQDLDEKMSRVKDVSIKLKDDLNKNYKKLSEELNKQRT